MHCLYIREAPHTNDNMGSVTLLIEGDRAKKCNTLILYLVVTASTFYETDGPIALDVI